MPTESPEPSLIEGEGHRNRPAESSRKRIDAAFALMDEAGLLRWDDLLYGRGGHPPPAPEREPARTGDRPASFRVVP